MIFLGTSPGSPHGHHSPSAVGWFIENQLTEVTSQRDQLVRSQFPSSQVTRRPVIPMTNEQKNQTNPKPVC